MPTFHIDIVNGNDASDGLTWGTAWKTFTNGATAARIAPGDDIRVAKTAAATSVGSATWTSGKPGNSITFATAPTKLIDTAKTGWVTMGAGSTVTNGQSTAYMTATTFGGTTVGALQWVTSASANGCYKDLGSTIDYSAQQQVCFWFRTTSAFDCTGTQNLLVDLCSDAGATTVVSALTAPKWNYAANMWYPIVIDLGSALSSTVRSIRIRTTNTTSQTFYVDEIFASPAAGLTLWSLIGLNNGIWYPIRSIRDADVQLLAGFTPSAAQGAVTSISGVITVDSAWMGTTTTATTWKLEPSRALLPSSGPASTFGVNLTEAASVALPRRITGGWNTSTNTVDGETWLDNVTQTSGSIGFSSVAGPFTVCENFGIVRFATTLSNVANWFAHNCHFVACTTTVLSNTPDSRFFNTLGISSITVKSTTGCDRAQTFPVSGRLRTFTYDEIWGTIGTNSHFALPAGVVHAAMTLNIPRFYPAGGAVTAITIPANSVINIDELRLCTTNFGSTMLPMLAQLDNSVINIGTISMTYTTGNNSDFTGTNNIFTIGSWTTTTNAGATTSLISVPGDKNIFRIGSLSLSVNNFLFSSSGSTNAYLTNKIFFHNWNGVNGEFRVHVVDGKGASLPYFELQGTDVYTAGSKAVRWVHGNNYAQQDEIMGRRIDLKLASAAAEANKLVTVTARVKRSTTNVDAGIYVPGIPGFLPGFTTDRTANCSSSGTFELLTITFTPTADCVFDVMANLTYNDVANPSIVWDALTITQAA